MTITEVGNFLKPIGPDDHDEPAGHIKTISGKWFDFNSPTVDIEDIAHALSMICRYGGHLPVLYSVADHCLAVSHQLERTYGDRALALAGLLHDAHEAYVGDVVGPLKRLIAARTNVLEKICAHIDFEITQQFGVTVPLDDPRVKHVDREILAWEMAMVRPRHNGRSPNKPYVVAREYVNRFRALGGRS